ncbi:helix-turn-helix domain-containing protein [Brevundimonas sp.]|uniref:helix-turn-helix domain-containing protein n=1 Tax=Brevundimonas sp. TaxID=1871086 RepID=UPI00286C4A35|nr:helix-turn-helix domain-containing protein [Brevundimonas sp.]
MIDIDIAELARQTGLRASTLRYYEEKGLIASSGRRGLKRLFDPGVRQRLSLIALGQAAGFSLDELGVLLAAQAPGAPFVAIDKTQLRARAVELNRRIEALSRMRDGLLHASACPAPSLMECPKFLRIVSRVGHAGRKPARAAPVLTGSGSRPRAER